MTKKSSAHTWCNIIFGATMLYGTPAQAEEIFPQVGGGIFYNFGASSDWGFEIYGNAYLLELSDTIGVPIYTGGNLQVNFSKGEKPTFVYSFQSGFDFLLAKSGIELGLATQGDQSAFQYGVHLHGLLPTVSWRSAKGLDKSYVGVGLRADIFPLGFLLMTNMDGRPLRVQEGFASLDTLIGSTETSFQKDNPWLSAAHSEWASIQAFEDLVRQLVSLQAPKDLIKRAKKAMDDEFRHTILCAGIASKISGVSVHLPEIQEEFRTPFSGIEGIIQLAIESWFDGCLNEGLAAEKLKYRAKNEEDEDALSALLEIIQDEEKHAELAWDILSWCLDIGGLPIRNALQEVQALIPKYIEEDWQRDFVRSAHHRLAHLLS